MMHPPLGVRRKPGAIRRRPSGLRICRILLPLAVLGFCSLAAAGTPGLLEGPEPEEANQPQKGTQHIRLLTLEEVVELSRQASPKLWSQRHIIDQAEAQLRQARAGRLPRLAFRWPAWFPRPGATRSFRPTTAQNC